ncbi:MAG: hypothetical protein AB8D78_12270 [Akkermansiaceae bacterium]
MSKPTSKSPSFGTLGMAGYSVSLPVLMFGGIPIFLGYIFLVTLAVPTVSAFRRSPTIIWRTFAIATVVAGVSFLAMRKFIFEGPAWIIDQRDGIYGYPMPILDATNILVIGLIFLPLSAASSISRLRNSKRFGR